MTHYSLIKSLLLLPVIALSTQAIGQLKPMDDSALDSTVGQAYIEMDSYQNPNNLDRINRITFGQTIKLQANADSLILGDNGTLADVAASNVSFGYIDSNNDIVPFQFSDPFFEWSTNTDVSGNKDLTGFRVGFGEAQGILQMDLTSFSGNINMLIDGKVSGLFKDGVASNNQANQIGVDGEACNLGTNCMSLANIKSLDVGDGSGGVTPDFFLSFQKTSSNWLLGKGIATGTASDTYQSTSSGFFMNIPTNDSITGSGTGTDGFKVEFIDRGVGRWN
ncbi:MAG: hypothetical protein ACI843_000844 [Psychrobacter glaciei]|jgi:hypothetical protein